MLVIGVQLAVGLALFALTLLAKIFLNVHLFHRGFVLARPGSLLLTVVLVAWIPNWIEQHGGSGLAFRATALGILLRRRESP